MKVTSITVTRGFTANIGNYNNVRFELGMSADLSEGETAEDALALLDKQVAEHVAERRRLINNWVKQKYGNQDTQGEPGGGQ